MAQPFRDRLKLAAAHARIEYSQTAIAKSVGASKQTVDRWMGDGMPTPSMLFAIADQWGVEPRWLATGVGPMARQAGALGAIGAHEAELLTRYRAADPRWQLSLRLLSTLATADQLEAASDVNMVIARILGKKPADVRYTANERVAEAYGQAPHVRSRTRTSQIDDRRPEYSSRADKKGHKNRS